MHTYYSYTYKQGPVHSIDVQWNDNFFDAAKRFTVPQSTSAWATLYYFAKCGMGSQNMFLIVTELPQCGIDDLGVNVTFAILYTIIYVHTYSAI
jgi:hypothetical protein